MRCNGDFVKRLYKVWQSMLLDGKHHRHRGIIATGSLGGGQPLIAWGKILSIPGHSRDVFVLGPWYLFRVARGVFVCGGADICAVFILLFVLLHYIWSLWHKLRARSFNGVGYFLHSKFFRNGCSSFLQQGHSGEWLTSIQFLLIEGLFGKG